MEAATESGSSKLDIDDDVPDAPSTDAMSPVADNIYDEIPEHLRQFDVLDEVGGDSGSEAEEGNIYGEGKIMINYALDQMFYDPLVYFSHASEHHFVYTDS